MSPALTLACFWVVLAALLALLPSRRNHWPQAYLLSALGLPVLGFVLWQHGPGVALLVALAMASVLRWPLLYLWRWTARKLRGAR